mmetsp:Transcript_2596/g.5835  ORF Transcript_2596/g.5835 Transcript_2596/m.5835 type:complete len:85 (-) Transcript_2596:17-271(-)
MWCCCSVGVEQRTAPFVTFLCSPFSVHHNFLSKRVHMIVPVWKESHQRAYYYVVWSSLFTSKGQIIFTDWQCRPKLSLNKIMCF